MKILHILDHSIPLHSGYTFRTRAILEHQRALGWQTYHVTSSKHVDQQNVLKETVDDFEFYRTPASTAGWAKLPLLNQWVVVDSLAKRLEQIIPEIQPDVLHAHSPALNGLAALRAGKKFGIPVVYECRAFWEDAAVDHGTSKEWGWRYRLTRALESHVFKHANAVTTICEGLRQDIIARGIDGNKVTVIPNAVNVEQFQAGTEKPVELQQKLGLEGKTVLGFFGSFYVYEGLMLLLQAMPNIVKRNPNIVLLLVGGGPQEPQIRESIAANQLHEHVLLTGRVPQKEITHYYNLADIMVYPRLPMRLTELVTPLKPLEAMAQKKLVIASDVGGHKELIRDGETGVLFEAGNASALENAVLQLVDARDQWPQYHEAGRAFVETERTWANSVNNYTRVYPL